MRAPAAPYGYTADNGAIRTPNVQRLAEEGLTFMSWYSSFHVCSPCKSSTGYKQRTRLLSFASGNGRERYRRGRNCGRNYVIKALRPHLMVVERNRINACLFQSSPELTRVEFMRCSSQPGIAAGLACIDEHGSAPLLIPFSLFVCHLSVLCPWY